VQPKKLQKVQSATATATPKVPVLIEPDDNDDLIAPEDQPTYASHWPKKPPTPLPLVPPPAYSVSLKDLDQDELIQRLYSHEHPPVSTKLSSSSPLQCMSENEILKELHHSGLSPPPVCQCDTPNASKTKSNWTSEELHKIMGCCGFRNYQHLIATSKDGTFFNSPRPHMENPLIVLGQNILILFMLIQPLEIVLLLEDSSLLSSSWIVLPDTIGVLV
jgi:hypothetical protein